jgi:hypothetical protein
VTQQTAAPELGESLLPAPPGGLGQAVVAELKRCLRPPAEIPLILAANAALMCGGWFLLPDSLRDWLFSIHGALAFPIVLESWMLSDVPSTNMLGGDARGALAALADPRSFQRFLYAKSLALWVLSAPLCAAIAIGIGTDQHRHVDTLAISAVILAMPLGVLGISAWVGIVFPYHPRSLRWRWAQRRHQPRSLVRWVLLVLTPYNFVPVICGLVLAPAVLLTRHGSRAHFGLLTSREFSMSALICCAMALAAFIIGHAVGGRLAEHRRARLVAYLTDPDRG